MRLRATLAAVASGALVLAAGLGGAANAEAVCTHDVRVLAQPRDGLTLLEKYKDEFKSLSGASFNIDYLNENDRRAKSRADASTVGKYNVYYIDEANVALFAKSNWVAPLLDYYPKEYDFADFDPGRQKVATFEDKVYFAPLTGGGDLLVYRKDLLDKAGVAVPKTLDEMIAAVKKLNDPDHGVYGIALRGQRGSGANVWRWMPYFRGFGGKWFDGDTPVFDGEPAVKATETYLELFKYSPPGTKTGSWDEFHRRLPLRSGRAARRINAARRRGDRSESVEGGRQGRLRAASRSSDRRRLRARIRHRNEGEQGRCGEEMRGPVRRLGDVEGEREAPPRRRSVRRTEPHKHPFERRVQPEVRRRSWPGFGRDREGDGGQLLAGP